jgi:hypothetical protein
MSNPFEEIEVRLSNIEGLISSLNEKQSAPKSFSSREETAPRLKITLPTLDKYTKAGIIKGSRIGSRVLYLESDIVEAVKEIPIQKSQRR